MINLSPTSFHNCDHTSEHRSTLDVENCLISAACETNFEFRCAPTYANSIGSRICHKFWSFNENAKMCCGGGGSNVFVKKKNEPSRACRADFTSHNLIHSPRVRYHLLAFLIDVEWRTRRIENQFSAVRFESDGRSETKNAETLHANFLARTRSTAALVLRLAL